ncbi:MAG TPA: nucleotidyltransferase domain-containing protein [Herpetosiphonaceae bacterium]|nr:nucleotidyltransferase domain-containing protein [Herpetosiphonaceae bacterium]
MGLTVRSASHALTLEQVVERLALHELVEGVVLVGSQARDAITPWSDYDILLVLRSMPAPLAVAYAWVGGRMADVIFVDVEAIRRIGREGVPIPVEGPDSSLARWLKAGHVVFDRGEIRQARQAILSRDRSEPAGFAAKYTAWFSINYNLNHNKRMLATEDPVYLLAVDLRLLYSVFDVLTGYFRFRDIPWRGEKEAIRFLAVHDADFLDVLRACLAETERTRKVALYEQLAGRTVEPMEDLWPAESTAVQFDPGASLTPETVRRGLQFWEELIGQQPAGESSDTPAGY